MKDQEFIRKYIKNNYFDSSTFLLIVPFLTSVLVVSKYNIIN